MSHILLSLATSRTTEKEGWHKRGGPYDDGYIDKIEDPSSAPLARVLTAIPSPFARVHLFDAAFGFVNKRVNNVPQHTGTSEYHHMVSECLDVLELLYGLADQATAVSIGRWRTDPQPVVQQGNASPQAANDNLDSLAKSPNYGQRLLAQTLRLYLQDDRDTAHFDSKPVFYELIVANEVLAISSPLTLFLTVPKAHDIAVRKRLIHQGTQTPYFSAVRALHERDAEFQVYVQGLFHFRQALATRCARMAQYVKASAEILKKTDPPLSGRILEMGNKADLPVLAGTPILDANQGNLQIHGVNLLQAPSSIGPRLSSSPIAIRAPRLRAGTLPPIVWTGTMDSFGVTQMNLPTVPKDQIKMEERVLPDLHAKYPYLCASDFLEDRLVQLPFLMNSKQFHTPRYEGFTVQVPGSKEVRKEVSFLLPLKPAFFEYFEPGSIPAMATFRNLGDSRAATPKGSQHSDGVCFELTIPTRDRTVTFQKNYFNNPMRDDLGKIVEADMNCAVFPFLSMQDMQKKNPNDVPRPSQDYWVMLVDGERERSVQQQDCFHLRFSHLTPDKAMPFAEGQPNADLNTGIHRRCDKALDAGSIYYRVKGGRTDLIWVNCFSFDKERQAEGLIAPNWPEKFSGTRSARVAIDFGTTNSHVAVRLEDEQPEPLRIASTELQVALLNEPNLDAGGESAKYDTFLSQLLGTEIRLHHEFIPSIIKEDSIFHFPLRTATSEKLNLKSNEFLLLQNINISFAHGHFAPRKEERIVTNLKWTLNDPLMEQRVRAFIEELLILVRTKLLLHDVDLQQVQLTWFRPLSFDPYTYNQFGNIWRTCAARVLGMPEERVTSLTESAAPYFYHRRSGMFTSQPTVCIDIGGGSTDVVFFDGKVPKFGTSFSFAGNALWGSGYAEVGVAESGVVRAVAAEVEDRLKGSKTAQEAFHALQTAQTPSQELMNFCFGMDAETHVTDTLSRNSGVKCLALLHYAAIIYHCAQLMKSKDMRIPEYLCFSGRGSQYLNILEKGKAKQSVAALSQAIFEHVYSSKAAVPIGLKFALESKEATCNGGLLWQAESTEKGAATAQDVLPLIAVGDNRPAPAAGLKIKDVDDIVKAAVADNLRAFSQMILHLSNHPAAHFKKSFGIEFQADIVKNVLTQKLEETLQFGLDERHPNLNPDEEISETLFFYPLIQNLYELGNSLL
jgi:hypothetical protein